MKYQYTAFNQDGESVTGEVEANSKDHAIAIIRSMHLYPIEITSTDDTTLLAKAPEKNKRTA